MSWKAPRLKEERFAGVETGAEKVKSESLDAVSKEVNESSCSLATSPGVDLKLVGAHKSIFSSEKLA